MSEYIANGERNDMERPPMRITRISEGLEYGDGKIAAEAVSPEVQQIVDDTIENHPDFIVPIDVDDNGLQIDDDGCGDGRGVNKVFRRIRGVMQELKRSLHRSKVFGGAVTMAAATRLGNGTAKGRNLEAVFADGRQDLHDNSINFGAHSALHLAPGREHIDCGCGAIDQAPQIVETAIRLESPIRETLKFLGQDSLLVDDVFDNYREYSATLPEQPAYSGKRVLEGILDSEKVVKELEGPHLECRIILNMVEGYTVNQGLIREVTDEQAQVFAVDVWRLQEIATNLYPGDPESQERALISELIYTLSTAGVLTRGDLAVYLIDELPVESPVPA
jgi:hypothetical protein